MKNIHYNKYDIIVAVDADNICSINQLINKSDVNFQLEIIISKIEKCVYQIFNYLRSKYSARLSIFFHLYHSVFFNDVGDGRKKDLLLKTEHKINRIFINKDFYGRFEFVRCFKTNDCDNEIIRDLINLKNKYVVLVTSDFQSNFQDCVKTLLDNDCKIEIISRMDNQNYDCYRNVIHITNWFFIENPNNRRIFDEFKNCLESDRFINVLLTTANCKLDQFENNKSQNKINYLTQRFINKINLRQICKEASAMQYYNRLPELIFKRIKNQPTVFYKNKQYLMTTENGCLIIKPINK